MSAKNWVEIVRYCENTLGWTPKGDLARGRTAAASALKKAAEKNPLVTLQNLEYAIEYSRRKKLPITYPTALVYRIEDALREAPDEVNQGDVAQQVEDAIAWELSHKTFGHEAWLARLLQAHGPGRRTVLKEWKEARHGG